MTTRFAPDQAVSDLTVADLDALITEIVRRVLREQSHAPGTNDSGDTLPVELLATFGVWDDERSTDAIVADIYASRTITEREVSL
ncbi:MAG: hypothetical protein HZB53_01235 [Chloroflexi bacterium]|nr:hypothetical protein [Chloroflexota bacterium]